MRMIVGFGFLIIGGVLVASLLYAIYQLVGFMTNGDKPTAKAMYKIFWLPIWSFIILLWFIIYGISWLEG